MNTLVLVPGLLCDHTLWAHQTRYLSDIAECLVTDITAADSIDELARAVLTQAPPRFALAGLSMGGIIAHAIMAMAPERVERLALIGTTARADVPEQTERRLRLIALVQAQRFQEVAPLLLPALLHSSRGRESELSDRVMQMANAIGSAAFLRQINALMNRPDRRAQLASYRVPTLILCGREDAITTLDMHTEMAAAIRGSELAIIEECGHLSPMERPHAVTALMRQWLIR